MKRYLSQLETAVRSLGRDIVDQYPSVRYPALQGWQCYQHAYAHLVCFRDSVRYARRTDLSPYDVVVVDPDRIEYLVEKDGYPSQTYDTQTFPKSKFKYAGTVHGGDWDSCERYFEETDLYRAFEAHFDRGVAWSETPFFDRVLKFIDDGVVMWGCTSKGEFEQRCDRVDHLYESIRTHGYLSRHQVGRTAQTRHAPTKQSHRISRSVWDEITVCIGRNGDVLFFDGRNRLAIAKLLELDAIPVWIMVRHKQWQVRREACAASEFDRHDLSMRSDSTPICPNHSSDESRPARGTAIFGV